MASFEIGCVSSQHRECHFLMSTFYFWQGYTKESAGNKLIMHE
jgi:hypothetical protein